MALDIEEIDAVIGQFLAFARGESEQQPEDDLDALLGELSEQYARRGKRVSFEPGGLAPLPFARQALRRAVANLVDNALRYAGEPVEIRTRAARGGALIEVLDRGPGVPPGGGRAPQAALHPARPLAQRRRRLGPRPRDRGARRARAPRHARAAAARRRRAHRQDHAWPRALSAARGAGSRPWCSA